MSGVVPGALALLVGVGLGYARWATRQRPGDA
jgi:hypothetical protein